MFNWRVGLPVQPTNELSFSYDVSSCIQNAVSSETNFKLEYNSSLEMDVDLSHATVQKFTPPCFPDEDKIQNAHVSYNNKTEKQKQSKRMFCDDSSLGINVNNNNKKQ